MKICPKIFFQTRFFFCCGWRFEWFDVVDQMVGLVSTYGAHSQWEGYLHAGAAGSKGRQCFFFLRKFVKKKQLGGVMFGGCKLQKSLTIPRSQVKIEVVVSHFGLKADTRSAPGIFLSRYPPAKLTFPPKNALSSRWFSELPQLGYVIVGGYLGEVFQEEKLGSFLPFFGKHESGFWTP